MNFYKRKRRMPTVIIVSLIDIFAILLIFVIVTTTFKRPQSAVVIKLPESANAAAVPQAEERRIVDLTISEEGAVSLRETPVPLEGLAEAIKSVASRYQIALRADEKAPFGVILKVLDALKEAGIEGKVSAFTKETTKKGL
jgi:biopolymer transport protein ExbD